MYNLAVKKFTLLKVTKIEFLKVNSEKGLLGDHIESEQAFFVIAGGVMTYTKPELRYHDELKQVTFSEHKAPAIADPHEDSISGLARGGIN